MTESSKMVHYHKFQESGMGVAPYRFVSYIDSGHVSDNCGYCGTAIRHIFTIEDGNGEQFVVGGECVRKTNDSKLIEECKAAELREKHVKREQERVAKYEREMARQREANGGYTLAEIALESSKNREAYIADKCNEIMMDVQKYIDILKDGNGKFRDSIAAQLENRDFPSGRALDIVVDIVAKVVSGCRSGKKHEEAADVVFETLQSCRQRCNDVYNEAWKLFPV